MSKERGFPLVILCDGQLMVDTGSVKNGKDTFAMESVKDGVSASHRVDLPSRSKVQIAVIHTEAPLVMLLHKYHRVPHTGMGWLNDVPFQ